MKNQVQTSSRVLPLVRRLGLCDREIFGGVNLGEVLAGAGVGAIASSVFGGKKDKEVEVVVVRPERDLALTLESDLVLRRYSE